MSHDLKSVFYEYMRIPLMLLYIPTNSKDDVSDGLTEYRDTNYGFT
jgi:hypothetical protein